MTDKVSRLIKQVQPVIPKNGELNKVLKEIKKLDLRWFWRKRLSGLSAVLSIILGSLTIAQAVKLFGVLDTTGFWYLIKEDQSWLADEPMIVIQAFIQAHPFKQIGLFLFLVCFFAFSLRLFTRTRTENWDKMKGSKGMVKLAGLTIYLISAIVLAYLILLQEAAFID